MMSMNKAETINKQLPEEVIQRVIDTHAGAIYYWSVFEPESVFELEGSDKYLLGLHFANCDQEYLVEDCFFDSDQEASIEAERLNTLCDIGEDLIDRIIASQGWSRHSTDVDAANNWLFGPDD